MTSIGEHKMVRMAVLSRLTSVDREQAQHIAAMTRTPNDAKQLAGTDSWTVRQLDSVSGRVYALAYKGCEVRLFFHRQFQDVPVENGQPVSALPLLESAEWTVVNLIGEQDAAKTQALDVGCELAKLRNESLDTQRRYKDARHKMEEDMFEALDEVKKYKLLAEAAVTNIGILRQQVLAKEQQLDEVRKSATARVAAATSTIQNAVVAELFSLVENLWWAVKHWSQDQVARDLFAQSEKSLRTMGYELIIPKEGDQFNPHLHHATEILPDMGEESVDKIVAVNSIGVRKEQVVIKAADVAVAQ